MNINTSSTCPLGLTEDNLSRWRDGELASDRMLALELHLGECISCQQRLARYERMAVGLQADPEPTLDAAIFWAEVRARSTSALPAPRHIAVVRGARRPVATVGAVAALLLIALGFAHLFAGHGPGSPIGPRVTAGSTATGTATPTIIPSPAVEKQWIPLPSQASADVVAAAETSTFFQTAAKNGNTTGLTHLGTAQLVRWLAPPNTDSSTSPDYFELPILDNSNAVIGAVNCELNPDHTAIYVVGAIEYSVPRSNASPAQISVQQAVSGLWEQYHVGLGPDAQLQLVYFAVDQRAKDSGTIKWTGGGESPWDPMWEVLGADGQEYFAGADGHVYRFNELPFAPPIGGSSSPTANATVTTQPSP